MANKSTKIKLRAFRIENPILTEANSGILKLLKKVLTKESIALDRCMQLNTNDSDVDLLSDFVWHQNDIYLFGMMLRVIPAENGGVIDRKLFSQAIITIADVSAGESSHSQYKSHFYFALNNDFLVTNLPGNTNIDRVQTYLNWLLESVRGERYFQLTEMTKLPEGVALSQISHIEFGALTNKLTASTTQKEQTTIFTKLNTLTDDLLAKIIDDSSSLEQIRNNQLVEAKLFLRIKKKPKDLGQEEFQKTMGALVTNITNDSGISLKTKDGNIYTGESIKIKKEVEVEKTTGNRIVEEQLKQKMELYLGELKKMNND